MTSDRTEYKKKYYQDNRDRLLKKQNEYNRANKESISEYQKDHYDNEYQKEYYKNNKKRIRQNQNRYNMRRRANDPVYKLRKNCSCMIWQALKGKKNQSMLDFLPYSMLELKAHLESKFDQNMSWDNYGTYWHIDHIMPQSSLPYTSMTDENFQKCWALDNLRPLEAAENIRKSNRPPVK